MNRRGFQIQDVGFGEFRRQVEYKSNLYGRRVVVVDRWFPSSKTCNNCGSYQEKMPLNIREWICADCGTLHDRDINAAKNIRSFATAGQAGIARGVGLRPVDIRINTNVETRTEEMTLKPVRNRRKAA